MCKQDHESVHHLFLQCEFAKMLWLKEFDEFGVVLDVLNNFLDLLKGCSNARWSNKIKEFWECVIWAVLWDIWRERNSRIFSDI